uniref:Uncharacterized protein n=1 Tax=Oryza sativa subsp. japonica TaxID=39947 RepID=Q69SA6_ORYSJ|nr:hypothetical protein [Oryza sativa Japonica Group]BAD30861.1 hypothetical protein [Oryza sativa Japonica Group]
MLHAATEEQGREEEEEGENIFAVRARDGEMSAIGNKIRSPEVSMATSIKENAAPESNRAPKTRNRND